jgi:hypothetical protein
MLPPIDHRGLLPPGVHVATLAEIDQLFATNPRRQHLLAELRRFIHERLLPSGAGLELFVCGSYFSDKADPGDIDCTVPVQIADVMNRLPVLALMNDGRSPTDKGATWKNYSVDFFVSLSGLPGMNDFVAFFQYVGIKTASLKNLNEKESRGIVKVEQWELG